MERIFQPPAMGKEVVCKTQTFVTGLAVYELSAPCRSYTSCPCGQKGYEMADYIAGGILLGVFGGLLGLLLWKTRNYVYDFRDPQHPNAPEWQGFITNVIMALIETILFGVALIGAVQIVVTAIGHFGLFIFTFVVPLICCAFLLFLFRHLRRTDWWLKPAWKQAASGSHPDVQVRLDRRHYKNKRNAGLAVFGLVICLVVLLLVRSAFLALSLTSSPGQMPAAAPTPQSSAPAASQLPSMTTAQADWTWSTYGKELNKLSPSAQQSALSCLNTITHVSAATVKEYIARNGKGKLNARAIVAIGTSVPNMAMVANVPGVNGLELEKYPAIMVYDALTCRPTRVAPGPQTATTVTVTLTLPNDPTNLADGTPFGRGVLPDGDPWVSIP